MNPKFTVRLACVGLAVVLGATTRAAVFNANSAATLVTAINSANSTAGSHTIQLAPGSYNLSGELPTIASGKTIVFQGGTGNPADTVVSQLAVGQRILETYFDGSANNVVLAFNNITFQNGKGGNYGGGAILVGGIGSSTTFNNCSFLNNTTGSSGGGLAGGAIENSPNGSVTVTGCYFQGNSAVLHGGAIDFLNQSGGIGSLSVSGSVFVGNTSAADGGAIHANCYPGSGTISVLNCNFEGNQVTGSGRGGAVAHEGQAMALNHNRFFGNQAANPALGRVIFQVGGADAVDANRNWWGQNTGPAANDINASGPVTATAWLQLRHVAGAAFLGVGGSTSLTADLLGLNSGGPLAAANLSGLPALPSAGATIFHDAVLGTLSGANTRFSQGVATATFTAGATRGTASGQATLDNQTVGVNILLPTSVASINRVTSTPSNLGSVQWTVTFGGAVSGVSLADFTLVNSGLGGAPGITGVVPVGGAPAAAWTVTASAGTGSGTLGLNLASATGISALIDNVPFVGQVYTIDLVAPTTLLSSTPPSFSASGSATFVFSGGDVGSGLAGFEASLDGGAFSAAASPKDFAGLADGPHQFQVRALDQAGNVDASPESYSWTVDTTPPSVVISPPSSTVTASGPVSYTVTYADPFLAGVTLAMGNVTLHKTGTADGVVGVSGSGSVRAVTISGISGDGTLGIGIAAGTASDSAGNSAPAAGPSATFLVSNAGISVGISPPSASTTVNGPVAYTVTYTSPTFDSCTLSPGDITLNATETATGTIGVSGSGNTRTVTISGVSGKGTLGISIAAQTATDLGGHFAPAAGPSATFDVNHPPQPGVVHLQRGAAQTAKVKVADLLAATVDADADSLTLVSVQSPSPNGAAVQIKSGWVLYAPPPGPAVADSFTFTVNDTRGGSGVGTVIVDIGPGDGASQNVLSIENLGGGHIRIRFAGVPGRSYTIQSSPAPAGPWASLGPAVADSLGVAAFDDFAGSPATFYRSVYP